MPDKNGIVNQKTNIVVPVIVIKHDIKSRTNIEVLAEIAITFKGFDVDVDKTTLGIESLCKAIGARWEDPAKIKKTEDDKYFIEKPDSDQMDYLKDLAESLHGMGMTSVERTESGIVMNIETDRKTQEVPY